MVFCMWMIDRLLGMTVTFWTIGLIFFQLFVVARIKPILFSFQYLVSMSATKVLDSEGLCEGATEVTLSVMCEDDV